MICSYKVQCIGNCFGLQLISFAALTGIWSCRHTFLPFIEFGISLTSMFKVESESYKCIKIDGDIKEEASRIRLSSNSNSMVSISPISFEWPFIYSSSSRVIMILFGEFFPINKSCRQLRNLCSINSMFDCKFVIAKFLLNLQWNMQTSVI